MPWTFSIEMLIHHLIGLGYIEPFQSNDKQYMLESLLRACPDYRAELEARIIYVLAQEGG